MRAVKDLSGAVGVTTACAALAIPCATYYRWLKPEAEPKPRPPPPRALAPEDRREVRAVLNSEEFVDQAPAQVYASLLDRGTYLCSVRTMYRILQEHGEVRELRDQLRHPEYTKPELLATGPNELWSWDITKLLGPAKWTHYHLYVILDVFSRYVVGWLLSERESAALAKRLIEETIEKHGVSEDELTLHSDRGPSMKSSTVAQLLADLGVTKSHSRPHTSNDNPFSEAQFKTLKYRPDFPKRFGSLEDGRTFCRGFFRWYNTVHRHSGIGLMTPFEVHYGLAEQVRDRRREVLHSAYSAHPERFVRKTPEPPALPEAVWINPPSQVPPPGPTRPGRDADDDGDCLPLVGSSVSTLASRPRLANKEDGELQGLSPTSGAVPAGIARNSARAKPATASLSTGSNANQNPRKRVIEDFASKSDPRESILSHDLGSTRPIGPPDPTRSALSRRLVRVSIQEITRLLSALPRGCAPRGDMNLAPQSLRQNPVTPRYAFLGENPARDLNSLH